MDERDDLFESLVSSAVKGVSSKLAKKGIGLVLKASIWIASVIGPFVIPVIAIILLPCLVIEYIYNAVDDLTYYEQECPELVKAFIGSNYEAFESEIRNLCNDPDFVAYVESTQFDTAYTKMVFGGTNTYTEAELEGGYKGIQDLSNTFITNKDGKYEAKSIIADIAQYQKDGVSLDNIYINDEYVKGYQSSNLAVSKDSATPFKQWLKASYYTVPYYYWYAGLHSDYGYKWTNKVSTGTNSPMNYYVETYENSDSYEEALDKIDLNRNAPAASMNGFNLNKCISYVPLAHTIEIHDSFWAKVQRYIKTAGSQNQTKLKYNVITSDETDLGKWFKYKDKNGNNNLDKYITSIEKKELVKYGARENTKNKVLEEWKDNFAEYLAKELYYIYPNRQYIVDYFLGSKKGNDKTFRNSFVEKKKPSREKKVQFLERSLYAMANGMSLDVAFDESYSIVNGCIVNDLTGKQVGSLNIDDFELSDIRMVGVKWDKQAFDIEDMYYCENNLNHGKHKSDHYGGNYFRKDELLGNVVYDDAGMHYMCPECGNELKLYKDVINEDYIYPEDRKTVNFEEFKKKYNDIVTAGRDGSYCYPTAVYYSFKLVAKGKNNEKVEIIAGKKEDPIEACLVVYSDDVTRGSNKKQRVTLDVYRNDIDCKELSNLAQSNFTWDKEYYKLTTTPADKDNEESVNLANDGKKVLDSAKMKVSNNTVLITDNFDVTKPENYESKNFEKYIKKNLKKQANDIYNDENIGLMALFDGEVELSEKRRTVELEYNDCSCFNWTKNEIKDNNGKVTNVTYEISMQLANIDNYDDDGTYRVAYAIEKKDTLENTFKLLQYFKENQTLTGSSQVVDYSQLFIHLDENGNVIEDKDVTLNENGERTKESPYSLSSGLAQIHFDITMKLESGHDYGAARNPIVSTESSLTVGLIQWYSDNAYKVLQLIIKENKKQAKDILGDQLYKYIVGWSHSNDRLLSDDELTKVRTLLVTKEGKKVQKNKALSDCQYHIDLIKKAGITNPYAILYLADAYNQSPSGVLDRVIGNMSKDTMKKVNEGGTEGLDIVHNLCKADLYTKNGVQYGLGTTASRRDKAYNEILKINLMPTYEKAIEFAMTKIGCPYSQQNRNGKTIFDCSNLVYSAFMYAGLDISNGAGAGASTVSELAWCEKNAQSVCVNKLDRSKLQRGDIIFFTDTTKKNGRSSSRYVCHVSIYLGDGKVIEAGSPVGVYNLVDGWTGAAFLEAYRIKE